MPVNQNIPFYLVSACLCGECCRYDGKHNYIEAVAALRQAGLAIAVCPEQAGGLPTPRPAAEIKGGQVINCQGEDVTAAYQQGAYKTLKLAQQHGIKQAILKDFSPSCGSSLIADGSFNKTRISGQGITTRLLLANGITVFSAESFLAQQLK